MARARVVIAAWGTVSGRARSASRAIRAPATRALSSVVVRVTVNTLGRRCSRCTTRPYAGPPPAVECHAVSRGSARRPLEPCSWCVHNRARSAMHPSRCIDVRLIAAQRFGLTGPGRHEPSTDVSMFDVSSIMFDVSSIMFSIRSPPGPGSACGTHSQSQPQVRRDQQDPGRDALA